MFSKNHKVDVLWTDDAGFTHRQTARVVRPAKQGSRGLAAMHLVQITGKGAGPYSGQVLAHRHLVTEHMVNRHG